MTRLTVLAGFGYAPTATDIQWTDITPYVRYSASSPVNITRGAEDELSDTQTGTLTMRLDNSDGRFTPGRASSPYYPYVKRNCPVAVWVTVLGGINYLTDPGFESLANGWANSSSASVNTADRDTTHVKSGTYAYRIGWRNSGTGGIQQCRLYGLTIGRQYTASVHVWVPVGAPAVRLDIDGTTVGSASTLTGGWQRITVTWTATGGSQLLRITTTTTSPAVGDYVWLDEGQVEEGAAATSWSSTPATVHARYFGMATSWPTSWQGLLSTVNFTASDQFKLLSRRPSLGPMLVEEVLSEGAEVYYPLSEPSSSVSAGDQSGHAYPSLAVTQAGSGGTIAFAEGIGPPSDGLGTPLFTPASSSAGKYLSTDIVHRLTTVEHAGDLIFECWFSTSVQGRALMSWATSDPAAFLSATTISLESGTGKVRVDQVFAGLTSTSTANTPNLADGNVHHLVYDEAGQMVWVDGSSYGVTTSPLSDLRLLTVGATYAGGSLWDGTISHVAAYVASGGLPHIADIVDHYVTGTTGHAGELSWERIARLATYAGVSSVIRLGLFSAVASQGELGQSPMSHMRDVERTEGGRLFCDRASAALVFHGRSVRYNPVPSLSLAYADLETEDVEFADDDQKLVNLIIGSRPGGATQRVKNAASISAYGPYQQSLDVLKTTDAEVLDASYWTILRYADPPAEMRQLPVIASSLSTATYQALLNADIDTAFTVTGLPAEAPSSTASVTVEGYTEQISHNEHLINFRTSRSDVDSVWVLDDSAYSVLDSTTRLAY
ncbi:hypothetical protein [Streptomyces sp. NPDC023838]|uniref:hypothetical protein n=1 Tax=Streptomyces sp. NPDC023838 TaxID=3154325 RepID=UPI0033CFD0CB